MEDLNPWLLMAGAVFGPAGACWTMLNGTRMRVKETQADVKEIRATLGAHGERLARIESKVEG